MSLLPGSRFGAYEIVTPLGAGGMGEVYRARDRELNREVAIKVLLSSVANDPDRLARFKREAQLLAALNHPNIAHIHGLEDVDGVRGLVMELVEGATLAERIVQGPVPLEEALPIARQIAEALEVAHEQGIIHRDLKPSNIKITPEGAVKILDFGLAKALDPTPGATADATISPTISMHATQAGVILGTAAYMSPEQARGKVVDRRADIWGFGCVVFEMLAGEHAFPGEDLTDTIVAIVSREPKWIALPSAASAVMPLLKRCLNKSPRQRLQSIGDARIEIEELIATPATTSTQATAPMPPSRVIRAAVVALVAGASIGALTMWLLARSSPSPDLPPSRFPLVSLSSQLPSLDGVDRDVVISPDGRYVAYRSQSAGAARLFLRPLDRLESINLGSISRVGPIFFSPDARWIGFFDTRSLRKIPVAGGPAITISEITGQPRGATWADDDNIIFTSTDARVGLLRVPARGGQPEILTTPDAAQGERNHSHPAVLPGGRGVLFSIAAPNLGDQAQVAVLDLTTGQRKTLIRNASQAEYVDTGHLLYASAGTLRAIRFDLEQLEVQGEPVVVIDDIWMAPNGAARYSISRTGTLVYSPGAGQRSPRALVWVDRKGNEIPTGAPERVYSHVRLSPDGTRAVLTARDEESDLWIWDFSRRTLRRLTFGPAIDQNAIWMSDGQRVLFSSFQSNTYRVLSQPADGTGSAEQIVSGPDELLPSFVTRDGAALVGWEVHPATRGDIVRVPLRKSATDRGAERQAEPTTEALVKTDLVEFNPEISPDERYIAYQSEESGRFDIYVRPFPRVNEGRWQISTAGGMVPRWSRQGELFYVDFTNTLMVVPVETSGAKFASGNPTKVFDFGHVSSERVPTYDVAADGQRFLMTKRNAVADPNQIVVVLNWFGELAAKLSATH